MSFKFMPFALAKWRNALREDELNTRKALGDIFRWLTGTLQAEFSEGLFTDAL